VNETEEENKTPEQSEQKAETAGDKAEAAESTATPDAVADPPEAEAKAEPKAAKAEESKEETSADKPRRAVQPSMMDDQLNISEDKSWYVVQAFSGYEASVKRSLLERIERAGLGKDFGEILVPTEEVVEIRGGQKRRSERKFFPGYVLVQMDLNDETWHLVKNVRVQDGVDKPKPKVLFDVGEVVLVTDGPFNDFNGVVEEVNFEKNKLLVAVQIFGRSTPVELEFSQVEKA